MESGSHQTRQRGCTTQSWGSYAILTHSACKGGHHYPPPGTHTRTCIIQPVPGAMLHRRIVLVSVLTIRTFASQTLAWDSLLFWVRGTENVCYSLNKLEC